MRREREREKNTKKEETNLRPPPPPHPDSLKRASPRTFPPSKAGKMEGKRKSWKRPVASIYQGCWERDRRNRWTGDWRGPQ